MDTQRPTLCRNALRSAGKPYPRSGCAVCKNGGLMGCPYDKSPEPVMTEARVPVIYAQKEKKMKTMFLALALVSIPAVAAKPKLPIGPMHCTPRGCTETIRPW